LFYKNIYFQEEDDAPALDMDKVETRAQVNDMHELLQSVKDQNKAFNMFEFTINPNSFSQTIENLFHLSFLVKDGLASTAEIDRSNSIPLVKVSKPPTTQNQEAGLLERRQQCVVAFDSDAFDKLTKGLKIKQTLVKNRDPKEREERRRKELEKLNAEFQLKRQQSNGASQSKSNAKKRKANSVSASQSQRVSSQKDVNNQNEEIEIPLTKKQKKS
jgi:hypothetical protein